jgi:transcriptional regulator GlxA family with amidase domain
MRAQELLEHSGDSIEQIAAECGLSPLMLRRPPHSLPERR